MSVITSFCPRRSDRSVVQTSKKAHLTYSLQFVYTKYSPCNRLCVSQPVREEKTQIPSATSGPLSCHYVYLLLWRLHGMSIYQDYNQHYHDYHYCHYSFINEYNYIIFQLEMQQMLSLRTSSDQIHLKIFRAEQKQSFLI